MVNWRNHNALLHQLEAFVKVVHFVTGIYIWEFVSTLNFEWSIFRGRRQRSWTAAFWAVIRRLPGYHAGGGRGPDDGLQYNKANQLQGTWLVFVRILANTSTTLALMLYALRSIAVWQRNIYLISFLIACLVTNVVLWMRLTVRPDVEWNGETRTCIITEVSRGLPNNVSMFATDVILFVIILCGVYQRNSGRHILSTMHREGLFWLAIATVVQLLPVIFIALDLNDVMNLMFQTPAIICSGIGATRMYRQTFDRHAGDLLEYLESSRDATTGEICFRRQAQLISRLSHADGDPCGMSSAPSLDRLPPALRERYVERFEGCEIRVEGAGSEAHLMGIDPNLVL